jgi:hypothetical protein
MEEKKFSPPQAILPLSLVHHFPTRQCHDELVLNNLKPRSFRQMRFHRRNRRKNGVTQCFAFTEVVWRPVDVESGRKFAFSLRKLLKPSLFVPSRTSLQCLIYANSISSPRSRRNFFFIEQQVPHQGDDEARFHLSYDEHERKKSFSCVKRARKSFFVSFSSRRFPPFQSRPEVLLRPQKQANGVIHISRFRWRQRRENIFGTTALCSFAWASEEKRDILLTTLGDASAEEAYSAMSRSLFSSPLNGDYKYALSVCRGRFYWFTAGKLLFHDARLSFLIWKLRTVIHVNVVLGLRRARYMTLLMDGRKYYFGF